MRIREYNNKKDKWQALSLINKVLYEIFGVKPKIVELDKGLFKKGGILYVAAEGKKIIGTVGIKEHCKNVARLKKLYVEKHYRGKGIAQKLLNKAQAFAKSRKYEKIILSTTPQMKAAIRFYEKNGFGKYRINKCRNQIFFRKKL